MTVLENILLAQSPLVPLQQQQQCAGQQAAFAYQHASGDLQGPGHLLGIPFQVEAGRAAGTSQGSRQLVAQGPYMPRCPLVPPQTERQAILRENAFVSVSAETTQRASKLLKQQTAVTAVHVDKDRMDSTLDIHHSNISARAVS
ncbi:MAG: hypothetical protein FRX49_03250 [Trebouxia sp. A1-2]|nr:MAG: hypothetical protein FRX49_03250 [Trebouxia sp. A1-2]